MTNWRAICGSCCSLLLLASCERPASGAESARAPLVSHGAWTRTADSGATAAVYFVLVNASISADTIKGVSSDAAASAGLHVSMQNARTMHMAPLTALPVPAEDSVAFRPLGAHVMLTGLRRPLSEGDTVTVKLEFVSGRSIEVRAGVRRP